MFALGRDEVGRTTQCPIVKSHRGLVGQKTAGGQRLTGITSEAERLANSHMAWQAHDPSPMALCSAVVMLTGYMQSGGHREIRVSFYAMSFAFANSYIGPSVPLSSQS